MNAALIDVCYHFEKHKILDQVSTESTTSCCAIASMISLERQMFWKVLRHVFVPSSGLDENNIKGAFYPIVPNSLLLEVKLDHE